ncbi:MAG: ABC transporter permease, partial [Pseudomonadota bacterium]
MILAVAKVMALQTVRDRGAIVLAFILPPLIFSIFATIFSGTGGSDANLDTSIVDLAKTPFSERLVTRIGEIDGITITEPETMTREFVNQLVKRGTVDNAIVILPPSSGDESIPPIHILSNSSTQMTGSILNGHLQRLIQTEFPGVRMRRSASTFEQLVGGLNAEQEKSLEDNLTRLDNGNDQTSASSDESSSQGQLVTMELVDKEDDIDIVSYFAGAIAFMFLLFSSMQAA